MEIRKTILRSCLDGLKTAAVCRDAGDISLENRDARYAPIIVIIFIHSFSHLLIDNDDFHYWMRLLQRLRDDWLHPSIVIPHRRRPQHRGIYRGSFTVGRRKGWTKICKRDGKSRDFAYKQRSYKMSSSHAPGYKNSAPKSALNNYTYSEARFC